MAEIFFSPLNQFRFTPNETNIGGKFNTEDFDKVIFKHQVLDWQQKRCYFQPVQNSDGLKVIVKANDYEADNGSGYVSKLMLKDRFGSIVKTSFFQSFDNNNYLYINDRFFFDSLSEGYYGIVLEMAYRYGDADLYDYSYFYSDFIHLKEKHEDTLWVQYTNYYSKLGIPFEQLSAITSDLGFRVHGSRTEIAYESDRTIFIDQDNNPIQLKANANRNFVFYFGGNRKQIPDYIIDKLNHIFTLSELSIDGVSYVPIDGSSLEKEGDIHSPLYGAKIILGKKDNLSSYNFIVSDSYTFSIIDFNTVSYPFATYQVGLYDDSNNLINSINTNPIIIQNVTQRTDYLNALNASLPLSINGAFAIDNNVLVFNKDASDNVSRVDNPRVYCKGFRIRLRYTSLPVGEDGFFAQFGSIAIRSNLMPQGNLNATVDSFGVNPNISLKCPSSGDYYCLVFVGSTSYSYLEGVGREFISIDAIGNSTYGIGSDDIENYNVHDVGGHFNQSLQHWVEGVKDNVGNVISGRRLFFEMFTNNYSIPSLAPYSKLGVTDFIINDSGMSSVDVDNFYTKIYDASLNGQLSDYPISNLATLGNVGSATSNSLVARNYLETVELINISV